MMEIHPQAEMWDKKTRVDRSGRRGTAAFLGNWDPLRQKKDAIRSQLENQQFTNEDELQNMLIDVAQQSYADLSEISEEIPSHSSMGKRVSRPVLFASFTREHGLRISRIMSLT